MRMRWSTSCICLLGMWRPTLGPAVRLWFSNHHESKDYLIQDPGSGRTRSPVALKPAIQWRGQPSKSAERNSEAEAQSLGEPSENLTKGELKQWKSGKKKEVNKNLNALKPSESKHAKKKRSNSNEKKVFEAVGKLGEAIWGPYPGSFTHLGASRRPWSQKCR